MATKAQLEAHIATLEAQIAAASVTSHTDSSFDTTEAAASFDEFVRSMMPTAPSMAKFFGKMTIAAVYSCVVSWLVTPYITTLMMLTSSALLQVCIYVVCLAAMLWFTWSTAYYVADAAFAAPAHIVTAFNATKRVASQTLSTTTEYTSVALDATKRVASQTLDTTVEYTNAAYISIGNWVAQKLSHTTAA